ncbi:MAG TPA: MBL fold metallo-hydrolase, partial [Candidatus Nitrosopolaris sp.]|nr:MBL fold metallo-hydrolase [Candidatus Nitrosopolaris sp.]
MLSNNNDSMSLPRKPRSEYVAKVLVRINGTLPDISTIGGEKNSDRAAEIKQQKINANTSCSIFSISSTPAQGKDEELFHLLIDAGEGVVNSIEKGITDQSSQRGMLIAKLPNAVLITHSHDDHINDLPKLIEKMKGASDKISVYCTKECRDQIINKIPQLAGIQSSYFNVIQPNESITIGPFNVIPVSANHGENSPQGSVIYIVKYQDKKIIMGWDFLSLPNVDENLLWNPDLLVLGTQTYNPHPETGMISVSEAYLLVRRWNVKECYLVHYSGLKDFEEGKNQWFRGPVKPMTTAELQKVIDSHLMISGNEGRFRIMVGKEGMLWTAKKTGEYSSDYESKPIGNVIEVEGLQKYTFKIEKDTKADKLRVVIEDRINRYSMQFDRPHK